MPEYLVTWQIDIVADSPREAADRAESYMRTEDSRYYTIQEHYRDEQTGEFKLSAPTEIDLDSFSDGGDGESVTSHDLNAEEGK